ncbi:unnamed protein product [Heligmosomoides polygyrus]|uniref:Uncharacterized protein n=1 Tax=Heligmosomoides polygyrus TaxID=6339 RepID=A0A3P7X4S5_HELPZ|nr:unnamed protein product [Heligmosomoides polygyrus]
MVPDLSGKDRALTCSSAGHRKPLYGQIRIHFASTTSRRSRMRTDLYISSRMCQSFLITAVTSTFGWWLAFFAPNQEAVYYMPDHRIHGDKVPSKELFLRYKAPRWNRGDEKYERGLTYFA